MRRFFIGGPYIRTKLDFDVYDEARTIVCRIVKVAPARRTEFLFSNPDGKTFATLIAATVGGRIEWTLLRSDVPATVIKARRGRILAMEDGEAPPLRLEFVEREREYRFTRDGGQCGRAVRTNRTWKEIFVLDVAEREDPEVVLAMIVVMEDIDRRRKRRGKSGDILGTMGGGMFDFGGGSTD